MTTFRTCNVVFLLNITNSWSTNLAKKGFSTTFETTSTPEYSSSEEVASPLVSTAVVAKGTNPLLFKGCSSGFWPTSVGSATGIIFRESRRRDCGAIASTGAAAI
ncbi:hypothetical protein BJ742DRAFT_733602 [Cladochytrium replicatum]|nr:hypothetical protein BJ742DRAFT_733602 [Cladochytrium replicatum]